MKIGDKVSWVSQSGGYTKEKQGVVVAIVPKNTAVGLPEGYTANSSAGYGGCRDHESVLVQVGTSRRLYWPRMSALTKIVREPGSKPASYTGHRELTCECRVCELRHLKEDRATLLEFIQAVAVTDPKWKGNVKACIARLRL